MDAETMKEEAECDSPSGQTEARSISDLKLPPCRVCEENASGFHYGVNTCEACKGFFRRSMLRREKYKCIGSGSCDITLARRNGCPFCRYNKCLAVGMSKNAIKTGRYTHKKRTQDILEIKQLKEGKSTDPDDRASQTPGRVPPSPVDDAEHEDMIQKIVEAHNKYIQSTLNLSDEEIEKEQQAYYEQHKMKVDMFGPMPTLPREEYDEIYRTTGIDIDNRQDMMRGFAAVMEAGIKRYVNFVKTLPGFSVLSSDDQANLIKHGRFEFFFFGSFRGYNNNLKVLSTSSGKCLHIHEVCKLWDEDFMLAVFNFADSLKALNLTFEECVLIKTLCVLFTDRCELQAHEQVAEIQWKIVDAFLYLLRKTYPRPMLRFAKIIDRLVSVRELTEWNSRIAKSLYLWKAVQDSPLLLDMLAT